MSSHPNAMLLLALTTDDLARKTYRAIIKELANGDEYVIKIGEHYYHHGVMEEEYESDFQISLPEGTIYFFNFITYGCGAKIKFDQLIERKKVLETWADTMCKKYHCTSEIFVTANYW